MGAPGKQDRAAVASVREEPAAPWREATFVVWRAKLQSNLCVTARDIPTVAPLFAWRVYEPSAPGAPLLPRRRRRSC